MFYKVNLFSLKSEFNFTHFVHYKVKIKTELKLTIERYKNASFLSEFCATNFSNSVHYLTPRLLCKRFAFSSNLAKN